jgi:uncharacterized repeat protein (TIGR01451 family)
MTRRVFTGVLLATLGLLSLLGGASSGAPTPSGTADLSLTKTDSPDPVTVGAPLTYSIQVSNAGPDTATNVVVTDNLPNGVTFVSAQSSQGSCAPSPTKKKITCTLGTIAINIGPNYNPTPVTVTIQVLAPGKPGTISNTASVDRDQKDPKHGNNSARSATRVVKAPTPTCHGHGATLVGTAGPDLLTGTDGSDVVFAWTGADRIFTFGGKDLICAGPDGDLVRSEGRSDTVLGGPGPDRILGGAGGDELRGGRGRDRLRGGPGGDLLAGGLGADSCLGGPGADMFRSC